MQILFSPNKPGKYQHADKAPTKIEFKQINKLLTRVSRAGGKDYKKATLFHCVFIIPDEPIHWALFYFAGFQLVLFAQALYGIFK